MMKMLMVMIMLGIVVLLVLNKMLEIMVMMVMNAMMTVMMVIMVMNDGVNGDDTIVIGITVMMAMMMVMMVITVMNDDDANDDDGNSDGDYSDDGDQGDDSGDSGDEDDVDCEGRGCSSLSTHCASRGQLSQLLWESKVDMTQVLQSSHAKPGISELSLPRARQCISSALWTTQSPWQRLNNAVVA